MQKHLNKLQIILSASLLLVLSGCATIFGEKTQVLNFHASKPTKIILTDSGGTKKYDVPGAVMITKGTEPVRYRVDCPNSYQQNVTRNVKGVFWLNIISGGVFGSGVDYLTGKMWQYDTNFVVPTDNCE